MTEASWDEILAFQKGFDKIDDFLPPDGRQETFINITGDFD